MGAAGIDRGAGQALQRERDVFDHVGQVGAFVQRPREPAVLSGRAAVFLQRRQDLEQALVEAGDVAGAQVAQVL